MFNAGGVLVSTSNKPPWELNAHGLQEDLFAHFVEALLARCDVAELSSASDYRQQLRFSCGSSGGGSNTIDAVDQRQPTAFFHPLGPTADAELERRWREVTTRATSAAAQAEGQDGGGEHAVTLPVAFGRKLEVPRACGGAALMSFDELCNRHVGVADYVALAARFHTLFLTGVPAMSFRVSGCWSMVWCHRQQAVQVQRLG